jgi:hypothetical protein
MPAAPAVEPAALAELGMDAVAGAEVTAGVDMLAEGTPPIIERAPAAPELELPTGMALVALAPSPAPALPPDALADGAVTGFALAVLSL